MSTDTPRTDEAAQCAEVVHQDSHTEEWVDASFARAIERELAETRRKLEELKGAMRRVVKICDDEHDGNVARPEWIQSAMRIVDEDFIKEAEKEGGV